MPSDDKIASIVPHTDSGFMTLLPPNNVQGLSILLNNGQWLEAPFVEGAFVVNGGDILHRWTNERFLSTPHKVRNISGVIRYAIRSSSTPITTRRSSACPPASRQSIRRSIRQSRWATTRSGSRLNATTTWPRSRPRPRPRSRRANAPPPAGRVDLDFSPSNAAALAAPAQHAARQVGDIGEARLLQDRRRVGRAAAGAHTATIGLSFGNSWRDSPTLPEVPSVAPLMWPSGPVNSSSSRTSRHAPRRDSPRANAARLPRAPRR